ncbi:unnamed protein product [Heterobilharzia americana]|nr:unnamed protein product [Heterobilharzia americana]
MLNNGSRILFFRFTPQEKYLDNYNSISRQLNTAMYSLAESVRKFEHQRVDYLKGKLRSEMITFFRPIEGTVEANSSRTADEGIPGMRIYGTGL